MKLWRLILQILSLVIVHRLTVIRSVSAVCEYIIADGNKLYNYSLAAPSKKFPHGVLSEDGYYKVSSNGTVVWFQLCDAMIFNHDPPRCFDCLECGGSSHCGMGCSALMSNNVLGYPVCTTIGRTPTITTDLIGNTCNVLLEKQPVIDRVYLPLRKAKTHTLTVPNWVPLSRRPLGTSDTGESRFL